MNTYGSFTRRGLALAASLSAGGTPHITQGVAGSGSTPDPMEATELPQPRQTLAAGSLRSLNSAAWPPATLRAAQTKTDYTLTELGVCAADPENGEILYKVYKVSQPLNITAGSDFTARFYPKEFSVPDGAVAVDCSPFGLLMEGELLPVSQRVMATGIPTANQSMDITALQDWLDALPRWLTARWVVTVTGSTSEAIVIKDFCGPGSLELRCAAQGDCVISNTVLITNCAARVSLRNLTINAQEGWTQDQGCVNACNGKDVTLWNCVLTGTGTNSGIRVEESTLLLATGCSISSCLTAVLCIYNSMVTLNSGPSCLHDNNIGCWVWFGGVVLLGADTPDLVGGNTHVNQGGIIVGSTGLPP